MTPTHERVCKALCDRIDSIETQVGVERRQHSARIAEAEQLIALPERLVASDLMRDVERYHEERRADQ